MTAISAAISSSTSQTLAAAPSQAPTHASDEVITVVLPDGTRKSIPLKDALTSGLVRRTTSGGYVVDQQAAAALQSIASAHTSSLPATKKDEEKKSPSEMIGKVASEAVFARSVLTTISNKGMPPAFRAYSLVKGVDRHLGGTLLPAVMKKGPIADMIPIGLVGSITWQTAEALPGALKTAKTTYAAAKAAGASSAVAGAKALLTSPKPSMEEAAKQAAKAAASLRAPWLKPVASLAKITGNVAFTLMGIGDVSSLVEHVSKHDTHGMMKTTEGRSAVLGALSGATTLATLYMPASPLSAAIDFVSYGAWLAQIVNDKGWLDAFFGSAEPEKKNTQNKAVANAT